MDYCTIPSPVGELLLCGDRHALRQVSFQEGRHPLEPDPGWRYSEPTFRKAIEQLRAYFAGGLREFDLPLAPGGTPFQLEVWQELQKIPYGRTLSYSELAAKIGRPTAVRAVGAANGRNPIPIIIPCHRVVGAEGSLTGFGGGLEAKRTLLSLEGALGLLPF
jgi:methylated-DNA-[protein]-cysteine S-methyltransferase